MKKIFLFILLASLIAIPTNSSANQIKDFCPTYNFSSLFYEDYYPGTRWGNKEITWSHNSPQINGKPVARIVSDTEAEWIRQSIKSWDDALDTVSFKEISNYQNAEINIGFTQLSNNFSGYWNALWQNNIRHKAYIQLNVLDKTLNSEDRLIHAMQHEIGNVLGLGDMHRNGDISSVLEDPFEFPFGNKTLSDFDTGLIRQLYGESTCASTFLSHKEQNNNIIKTTEKVEIVTEPVIVVSNKKIKHSIVCIKENKKIIIYRYDKNYRCLKGYTKQ